MANITWSGKGADSSWRTPENWNGNNIPSNSDDVVVAWADGDYTYEPVITTADSFEVTSLTLGGNGKTGGLEVMGSVQTTGNLSVGGEVTTTLKATGSSAKLNVGGDIIIGDTADQQSEISLHSGAILTQETTKTISVGSVAGSSGFLIGTNSPTTATTGNLIIGDEGTGLVRLSDQASVTSQTITLGSKNTGVGSVVLESQGNVSAASLIVGNGGQGSFVLAEGGSLKVTGNIDIAKETGSKGSFTLGGATIAQRPGSLTATTLQFGSGDGVIMINTTATAEEPFVFSAPLSGTGKLVLQAGYTQMGGAVSSDMTTTINGGTLILPAEALGGTVTLNANGAIAGPGKVNSLDLKGTLGTSLKALSVDSNASTANTVEITEDITSEGGAIYLSVFLGDDTSASDYVHFKGNIVARGDIKIHLNVVGGAGAQTTDGIKILSVDGNLTGGEFLLDSNNFDPNGDPAIKQGDYFYELKNVGKDWLLKSIPA